MGDRSSKIAVAGTGYWGKNLVRNYHAMGDLAALCDTDQQRLASFGQEYPGIELVNDYRQLLADEKIAGVVIATPAETHFGLAKQALMAGKHVYVEKPLVLEIQQAEELIQLADQNKRILMVGHLLQYHPIFQKLKEVAHSGELGRMNYIYSNRLNLGKIRREENILWSFAPHDISMILALSGEEPESVTATGGYYLHQKIADVTTTHLEFPSGRKAHIFVSWLHPYKEQKLVVVGDRKMAVFDDTRPWDEKLMLYPHQISWKDDLPVPNKAEAEKVVVPQAEPLRLECEHFLHCIRTGETPLTDGREGLKVLRILKASQSALDTETKRIFLKAVAVQECKIPERRETDSGSDSKRRDDRRHFQHATAVVDDRVRIGSDTKIWHFSHILSGSEIGDNCNIGQNVVIGPDVKIGPNCKIQNNVSVYKGVTLEEGVFCGPSMVFTNVFNPRAEIRKMDQVRSTVVRRGATIGANATIVCGITIGRYTFIGAGAVVTRDVPDYALVLGNPAKQTGWVCQCGEKLSNDLSCLACKKRYRLNTAGAKLSEAI